MQKVTYASIRELSFQQMAVQTGISYNSSADHSTCFIGKSLLEPKMSSHLILASSLACRGTVLTQPDPPHSLFSCDRAVLSHSPPNLSNTVAVEE